MSPTKLTEDDKQEIVRSYRDPQETTTTLATRFNVSSSTISRLLKSAFSAEEYNALIQQKRFNRGAASAQKAAPVPPVSPTMPEAETEAEATEADSLPKLAEEPVEPEPPEAIAAPSTARSDSPDDFSENLQVPADNDTSQPPIAPESKVASDEEKETVAAADRDRHSWLDDTPTSSESADDEGYDDPVASMWGEDCDSLDEDDWEDESDEDDVGPIPAATGEEEAPAEIDIEILPLSAATFPRTCYLVIDRAGELVVKPLKEFQDLGRLPDEEFQQKTLVVFDNHKVARRYSNSRTQRVVKIPDGHLLHKTSWHLQGKGISRILMDGHVYALTPPPQNALS